VSKILNKNKIYNNEYCDYSLVMRQYFIILDSLNYQILHLFFASFVCHITLWYILINKSLKWKITPEF
jgi:hypothetical protein